MDIFSPASFIFCNVLVVTFFTSLLTDIINEDWEKCDWEIA